MGSVAPSIAESNYGGRSLSYYASLLPDKKTHAETPIEGYRIYLDVPFARSGSMVYRGSDLKKMPGYQQDWNLLDDEKITVYRTVEELTNPLTIASFEGKSILDEHPAGEQCLVSAEDEYDGVSKGHIQNIRVGSPLPSGEVPLIGDIHIKHPDLQGKIEMGITDVSAAYQYNLFRDSRGVYTQKEIRGNHVAAGIPVGRGGKYIGIGDAADVELVEPKKHKRSSTMSRNLTIKQRIATLLFMAKDAKPDEIADALDDLTASAKDEGAAEAKRDEEAGGRKANREEAAKDESESEAKKDDAEGGRKANKELAAKDGTFDELVAKLVKQGESEEAAKKIAGKVAAEKGKDAASKDADDTHPKDCRCDAKDCVDARAASKDADLDSDPLEEIAEYGTAEAADDGSATLLGTDDMSHSVFSIGDAATHLDTLKSLVAASTDPAHRSAYRALRQNIRRGAAADTADPFVALASAGMLLAEDRIPERSMLSFFQGVPYADGLAAWSRYQETNRR